MDAISQTIFSDAFSRMKKKCILIEISLQFVPKGPIGKQPNIGLDNGLAPNRRQAII